MDLKKYITERPAVAVKWSEIKEIMATHLMGKPPELIFRTRRPLESTNDYALAYRLDNFQPITKQSFKVAIDAIIETANHIHVKFDNINQDTSNYISEHKINVAGKSFLIPEYVEKYIGRMVEVDPNSVLVTYPVHPSEPLIPDYREELPNFNNIQNSFVDLKTELISSDKINKVDNDKLIFEAGQWIYTVHDKKEQTEPFYYVLTKEATALIVPVKANNGFTYELRDYLSLIHI